MTQSEVVRFGQAAHTLAAQECPKQQIKVAQSLQTVLLLQAHRLYCLVELNFAHRISTGV